MNHATIAILLCLVTLGAGAQPVYRCGNTYSQTACPQGKVVEATDPRTAAQRAEARRVAADERRFASEMRRDRLAEQAKLKPAGAASLSGPAPATARPASAAKGSPTKKTKRASPKPDASDDFIAVDPADRTRRGRK